jgi:drug/metabolite transporter (DMT)-like permease
MSWLIVASLLWAFSFGLIKRFLPDLDPWWVAAVRLGLSTLAFTPWMLGRAPAPRLRLAALALGAVQFGAMYALYIASFRYLAAWQVALWTVLTPVLVVLLARLRQPLAWWRPAAAAVLAVGGALLAQGRWPEGETLTGVLLVQGSNLCFAAGQLGFRPLAAAAGVAAARPAAGKGEHPPGGPSDRGGEAALVGWMSLGGALLAAVGWTLAGDPTRATVRGAAGPTLLYLGLVPTALGFWLWNKGAARTGPGRLAVANNLKVPLAVLVAWLVFGEDAAHGRALAGLAVVLVALSLAGPRPPTVRPGRGWSLRR